MTATVSSSELGPSQLFLEMMAMPRASRVVDVPRMDPKTGKPVGQVRIQVLTEHEHSACIAEADTLVRETLKVMPKANEARRGYDDLYNNAAACELLFRACRDAKDIKVPFFPGTKEMRRVLTADEIGVMMNQYLTVQAELGPIIATQTREEMDAMIAKLIEGGSRSPLDLLSWDALKTLVVTLVHRLSSSPTAISSAGEPPASGTAS